MKNTVENPFALFTDAEFGVVADALRIYIGDIQSGRFRDDAPGPDYAAVNELERKLTNAIAGPDSRETCDCGRATVRGSWWCSEPVWSGILGGCERSREKT